MKITLTSVFVEDPAAGLKFYTEVLGFLPKIEMPDIPWYTVVSPEDPDGTQLLMEPSDNPLAQTYKQGLKAQGISAAAFQVKDIQAEFARLKGLGVQFTSDPTPAGPVIQAQFDDTCGNLIQIYQLEGV